MRLSIVTCAFLAVLGESSATARAQTVGQPQPISQAQGGWARWRLGYSGLTFEMPGTPQFVREEHGDEQTQRASLEVGGGQLIYLAESFPHDFSTLADMDSAITNEISQLAQQIGGYVRINSRISVGRYRGADVVYDIPSSGRSAYMRLLVGREFAYITAVIQPSFVPPNDAARYNGSLQLDEADAPDSDGDGAVTTTWAYEQPFGADFAIRMPGHPRRANARFTANGRNNPAAVYTVESPTETWQVTVCATRERPDSHAFASFVATYTSTGWQIRDERPVTVQGFAGRSYVLVSADGRTTTNVRVFATHSSLYGVRASVPTPEWTTRRAQIVDYFNSLRIL